MPRVLFTAESAKLMALKSLAARSRRLGIQSATVVSGDEAAALFARTADNPLSARSNYVRGTLADILVRSADVLKAAPWKPGISHATERGEAVKLLATSASQVFGWDAESGSPLILVGEMKNCLDIKPAACGAEPTTGSVQPACADAANTTSAQVPYCQQLTDKPTEQK